MNKDRRGAVYRAITMLNQNRSKEFGFARRDATSTRGSLTKQIVHVKKMAQEAAEEEKKRERMRREKSRA